MSRQMVPHDGNSAVAHVAHSINEVIAIYPITPSSPMGEIADAKSAAGQKNIWGTIPVVAELQSEGGASGAVHGALTTGALATTFTASQGLLLMLPNMYKIAGKLTSAVFHVSARSLACQALSIFGDHSDVMAARQTGFGLLASNSVQQAMDFALISQAITLESRIPFIHFFEGFRVSHEIQKIEELTYEDMKEMIDDNLVREHRKRGLNPDSPAIRGTSQNPDVYFQGRETVNKYYKACPAIVQKQMDKFAKLTGRQYHLFDYYGHEQAEKIIIIIGCGGETVQETVEYLNAKGEKLGVIKVHLYRPFDVEAFSKAVPATATKIAVLDRTKEPGSIGEPLYGDIRTAVGEAMHNKWIAFKDWPVIVGGRYGLGSSEFTPAMVKGVFDNLNQDNPKNHFVVGIVDDVTDSTLDFDPAFSVEDEGTYRAMFYGLGSDGTVGANKNSIKIIGEKTDNYAQGYFVYDSKKAGAITISHLRFGKKNIQRPYLISTAQFLACHNWSFLEKYNMLKNVIHEGIFLLNSPYDKETVWKELPCKVQKQIIDKKLKFYVIDAIKIAEEIGLGARINTIMQTAFFKISQIMDENTAIDYIKEAIKKTYGKKGDKIVQMNFESVDKTIENIQEVSIGSTSEGCIEKKSVVPDDAPEFVKNVTATLMRNEGDTIKVSQMPADGTWPTGTTQYEKRNIAVNVPVWNQDTCIQCGRCSVACPHAVIRVKMYKEDALNNAPKDFKSTAPKGVKGAEGLKYTLQISPEDCTGCGACVESCPAKQKEALKMEVKLPILEREKTNFQFFNSLEWTDAPLVNKTTIKGMQFVKPLFEFSGACAGCGETPNVKLLTGLFGDRALIANATGCSSIYGGNLPTTPYTTRKDGRGPVWNNSLFEDAAELAYGMKLTVDKFTEYAFELLEKLGKDADENAKGLIAEIKSSEQLDQDEIEKQRERVAKLIEYVKSSSFSDKENFLSVTDYLVKKSVWGLGGDGWAYDIGYGGLDHVLASGKNINLMVLDTEVYSNTGGQASKATPRGAVAKFAASGKTIAKKDLGMIYITYGYVYVARIAMGADPNQALKAIIEAERYNGPSLIITYTHCIAHGYNLVNGADQQKKAVASGYWPLYRYNPDLADQGKNPLQLDSKDPSISLMEYIEIENRYKVLQKTQPEVAEKLMKEAQNDVTKRFNLYKQLASLDYTKTS